MTIDSLYFPERYTTGDHLRYPFTFEVVDPSHVEVFVGDGATRSQLVYNTDYTVELGEYRDPIYKNGIVVLAAAVASGQLMDIERNTAVVNDNDFSTEALKPFDAPAFEFSMDKITMIMQEIEGHFCDCRECLVPVVTLEVYADGVLIEQGTVVSPANPGVTIPSGTASVELRAILSGGTSPFNYQWSRRGQVITGATSSNYVFAPTAADDGAEWEVSVGNDCGVGLDNARGIFTVETEVVDAPPAYVCNAVELSLAQMDHYWPMDDPARSATVPANFHREVGLSLNLSPSRNAGETWADSQDYDSVNTAGLDLGGFLPCSDRDYIRTDLEFNSQIEFSGYDSNADIRGYYQTVVTDSTVTGLYALDYIMDLNFQVTSNVSSFALNPRLTVQVDVANDQVIFTGSFNGGNPSTIIPLNTSSKMHVITVRYGMGSWIGDVVEGFLYVQDYDLYVDDQLAGTLSQNNNQRIYSNAAPTFTAINYWHALRGGDGSVFGVGYDPAMNRHDDVWQAVLNNTV